jgi:hypothetical protein
MWKRVRVRSEGKGMEWAVQKHYRREFQGQEEEEPGKVLDQGP